jgi:hypothetical protein
VRPRGKAGCEPGHNMIIGGKERSAAQGGNLSVKALPSLRACGARPSEGRAIQGKMALRGEPGDNAGAGFLGGTHSVRPRCRARRKPGHNMIIGGKRTPGGQMGTCSGEANSVVAGVRSPPLRRIGDPSSDGLAGKGPRLRERRFFRRDALCASAWQGRMRAEARHDRRELGEGPVAKRW